LQFLAGAPAECDHAVAALPVDLRDREAYAPVRAGDDDGVAAAAGCVHGTSCVLRVQAGHLHWRARRRIVFRDSPNDAKYVPTYGSGGDRVKKSKLARMERSLSLGKWRFITFYGVIGWGIGTALLFSLIQR